MANLGDIAKREDRTLKVGPFDSLPSGAESWDYIIGFRAAATGADLTSATFGTAERVTVSSGVYHWLVPLPSAKTTLLSVGKVHVAVWRVGTGVEALLNAADDYVMVLDRPGNA